MKLLKKYRYGLMAAGLLLIMFITMVLSSKGDSAIVDEIAHIPAGYSYLTTGDYRLNPEHPPFIKDAATLPLLFMNVHFPFDYFRANVGSINNQWETGWKFIYHFGNDPNVIILASRIPVMLLSLLLGYFVYRWAKELFGKKAGIFALVLFVFDANIIAHSRFVTTDLGISLALFLSMYTLYKFIKKPSWKTISFAGGAFGLALISKFSAAILAPIFAIVFLMLLISKKHEKGKGIFANFDAKNFWKRAFSYLLSFVIVGVIGFLVMWIFYIPHTINLSPENQRALIEESLPNTGMTNTLKAMSGNVLTRPVAQYFLGFFMVSSHVEGGHDSFLLGQVSNQGWWYYYPVVLLLKVSIPIFIFIGLVFVFWKRLEKKDWFTEIYLWVLPFVLLVMGMQGSINLGIRYMLPMFPFIFIFLSRLGSLFDFKKMTESRKYANISLIVLVFLVWYVVKSLITFPHYLPFYNEFVRGGYKNGYKYLTDSNTDWGQDLYRLNEWAEKNNVKEIYVDYFGGGVPEIALGNKFKEYHVNYSRPKGYLAISATFYQNSRLKKLQKGEPDYSWLEGVEPIENIGGSILVYDLRSCNIK